MKHFLIMLGILVVSVILTILINYAFESSHSPEECEIKLHYTGIYNGHSYLYFNNSHSWIHDPDCQYCQEKISNAINKYILDHFPTNHITDDYGCGIMLTDTKPNFVYGHGIPAPRDPNDPPWVHKEYPVLVIEGLTEEERNKWFPTNNLNSIIITNPFSISDAAACY